MEEHNVRFDISFCEQKVRDTEKRSMIRCKEFILAHFSS